MKLIFITGESAQGKTPMATELSKKYGFYLIHTDQIYHNAKAETVTLKDIGKDLPLKENFFKSHRSKLTDITIVEGAHTCNKAERELIKRYLNVQESFLLKVENPNYEENLEKKHKGLTKKQKEGLRKWFESVYDPEDTVIIRTLEDMMWFVEDKIKKVYVYQDGIKIEKKFVNLNYDWKGKSIFDIGCNIGNLGEYLQQFGISDYFGIDMKEDMIGIARIRHPYLKFASGDIMQFVDREEDVAVAMAVYHHFSDDTLLKYLKACKCKEMIFEVPVGNDPNFPKYHLRSEEFYINAIKENYGEVVEIVNSGATNDPYNQRRIFVCKKSN